MASCARCSTEVEPGNVCSSCGLYMESWAQPSGSTQPSNWSQPSGSVPPPPPPPPGAQGYPGSQYGQPAGQQFGSPYGGPGYGAVPPDVSSKKLAAGICGILLGAFGVHKFVLGYTSAGLVMLLTTVVTCGIAGVVFGVIGLVEGIIYLTKSDAEFVQVYQVQKKPWF